MFLKFLVIFIAVYATHAFSSEANIEMRTGLDYYPDAKKNEMAGRGDLRLNWRENLLRGRAYIGVRAETIDTPWGENSEIELREAYLTWQIDQSTLRIGRQQIAWGRADAFRLLDTVNPLRYPDAFYMVAADARIPLWMVQWDGQVSVWEWQLFAGPDRRLNAVDPSFPLLQPAFNHSLETPKGRSMHGVTGARLSRQMGELDLGLYWLNGWNHEPLWQPLSDGDFDMGSARRYLWGASADWPAGPGIIRAEWVYSETDTFNTDFSYIPQRQEQALVGFDWEYGHLFFSPQLYWEATTPGSYNTTNYSQRYVSLLAQYKFLQNRGNMRLFWWHQIGGDEEWLSLKLGYEWDKNLELRTEVDWFYVNHNAEPSAFDELDRIKLEAVWRF